MIDSQLLRTETERVKSMLIKRGLSIDLERILGLDIERRALLQAIEQARAERKGGDETKRDMARQRKEELALKEEQLRLLDTELNSLLATLPNLLDSAVPEGTGEEGNVVVREVGTPATFSFEPLDHLTLGESLDIIDVKRAAKIAGSRFYYLKGKGALLRLALINFAFDRLTKAGFTPFFTPHLAKERTLFGTGYLPFAQDDSWKIEGEDLYLIGTSEQTLVGYHTDELLSVGELPLKYCAYSSCFRTEAGSYGKDTKGIIRQHEFAKVEMIVFTRPEQSAEWMEKVQAIEEEIVEALELPYRVTEACAGDLSKAASRRWDIEVWFPAERRYREVTSNSNLLDFQTRRLHIRAKSKEGEKFFPHTISATAVTDRHLIAIFENFQQADGSVTMPKQLQPYCGFEVINGRP